MTGQLRRAAQYVRMSTDHQRYSLEFQATANAGYALEHGLEVVRTYTDAGISGLGLARREGLKALLADILGGQADFEVVLVYDVSRWGRFQDPDQAAHYEFICREAGVGIIYTAEPFENDGSVATALVKHLKRAMAAEYSRELSAKISASKRGLGLQGYWPGGNPGFGLRRGALAAEGQAQLTFEPGERNAIKGRRIVVMPGPKEEVALVRQIFELFTSSVTTPNAVARVLNAQAKKVPGAKRWTQAAVRVVLCNELYIGTRIIGRAKVWLGTETRQPEADWVRVRDAAEAIISASVFREAQRRLIRRLRMTDAEMLEGLRVLLARAGRLSHNVLARDPFTPGAGAYRNRFGSLPAAFTRVGYVQTAEQQRLTNQISPWRVRGRKPSPSDLSNEEVISRLTDLREREGGLTMNLIEVSAGVPRVRSLLRRFGSMETVYRLSGHEPSPRQRQRLNSKRRPRATTGST